MKTRLLFLLVALLGWTAEAQNPTPIANLSRTNLAVGTNLLAVVAHPGQTNGTRGITLSNLLHSLTNLSTWPPSSVAAVTNAIGTVKTNGVTVGSANTAMSLDIIQGSNTVVRMTNTAGAVTLEINAVASSGSGSGASTNANQFGASSELTLKSGFETTNGVQRGFTISQTNFMNSARLTNTLNVSGLASIEELSIEGVSTNNDVAYFNDGIVQSSIQSAGLGSVTAVRYLHAGVTTGRAAAYESGVGFTNSPVTSTELGHLSGVTSAIQTQFLGTSNRVVVVGGTGGITVTPSGSGGVMTYTVSDDDAGGGSTTNFNTIGVGSQTLGSLMLTNPVGMVAPNLSIWDDFEGFSGTVASLSGRKPRGGFNNYRISGVNSNNAIVTNGVIKYPDGLAVDNQAIYIIATNSMTSHSHPWNHAYMKLRFTNDAAYGGGITDVPTFLIEDDAAPDGVEGLHIYITTGILNAFVGNSNILSLPLNSNPFNVEFIFGFTVVSNTLFVQVGEDVYIGTHPAIHDTIQTGNNLTWELIGAGTNQYRMSITEIGAGWAAPALQAFAGRAISIGTNGTIAGLTMDALTASRALVTDAGKRVTNSAVTATELGYLSGATSALQTQINSKQNGSAVLTNIVATGAVTNMFSAGNTSGTNIALVQNGTNTTGGIRTLTAGAGITITERGSTNLLLAATAGSTGGTNYPPVIQSGTNITIGVGVRQHVTLNTNASFGINFTGTALNGETVRVGVSNRSASIIYWTNYQGGTITGAFDPSVGSNVTAFAVPATSIGTWEFVWHTNYQANGSVRQEIQWHSGLEYELATGGHGRFTTNAGVVTHYPAFQVDYIDAGAFLTNSTNWAATYHYTNHIQGAAPQIFYTFADAATNEVFFRLTAPAAYDGTPIKAKFHWTSTNLIALKTNTWGIAAKKASGVDWDDTTFGTRVDVRADHTAGKEFNTSSASAAITINGSPVGGNLVAFRVVRDPNDANDNMVGINRLHAVELQWGLTNAVVSGW